MRYRPEQHLRRQGDFRAARELGRRIECGAFTLWWRQRDPSEISTPAVEIRVGVVASTNAVGIAVQRARAKRRLREVFRRNQQAVPPGFDLLLIARAAVNKWDFAELEQKFVDACRKIPVKPIAVTHD